MGMVGKEERYYAHAQLYVHDDTSVDRFKVSLTPFPDFSVYISRLGLTNVRHGAVQQHSWNHIYPLSISPWIKVNIGFTSAWRSGPRDRKMARDQLDLRAPSALSYN